MALKLEIGGFVRIHRADCRASVRGAQDGPRARSKFGSSHALSTARHRMGHRVRLDRIVTMMAGAESIPT